ncbi:DUF2804 domain-containing protein [Massilia sp. CF038]|uniref:DUF2804 domain-containing protein n=1 Tax=Massilia sp. CF038 TaxID=1881045 RepID=UPI00092365BA|nr:DUF2804 domain-containing protein [Massilia sp. CF038]SHG59917.1 Protein of unknown function [Massilia sp. CF038]
MTLAAAPRAVVDAAGQPVLGKFAGLAGQFDWPALAPPWQRSAWWRRFHHKRWHYAALACDEVFCAVAIVDLGWTSTAFAYAFERPTRSLIASFAQDGLPGMGARVADHAAGESRFRFGASRIALRTDSAGVYALTLRCKEFEIDASFGGPAPQLLAVGTVSGGSVHATQKSGGMALTGALRVGSRQIALDGGVASVDYSNGLLARETDWRWACGHSLALGFNLQAGYFGAHENALWLDGQLHALGPARFEFDARDPMAPWQLETEDGLLSLLFTPEGMRHQDKNLIVAASHYVQPIGTFSGWVRARPGAAKVPVSGLPGVTEDHRSRW